MPYLYFLIQVAHVRIPILPDARTVMQVDEWRGSLGERRDVDSLSICRLCRGLASFFQKLFQNRTQCVKE